LSMLFPRTCAVKCALLGYYAASSGNSLPTFRDNISAPPPSVIVKGLETLKMWPIGCPETSVRNYHYSLRNNPKARSSHLLRGGSLKSRIFLAVFVTGHQAVNIVRKQRELLLLLLLLFSAIPIIRNQWQSDCQKILGCDTKIWNPSTRRKCSRIFQVVSPLQRDLLPSEI
jgi:hypothetical protein